MKMTPARRVNTGADLARKWSALPHLGRRDATSLGRELNTARAALPPA